MRSCLLPFTALLPPQSTSIHPADAVAAYMAPVEGFEKHLFCHNHNYNPPQSIGLDAPECRSRLEAAAAAA
jgi:hypothetical protein